MRWKPLAMVAALGLGTACGQPVVGTPVAGAPSLEDQFDPCTIPDDAIAATGLDPGSRKIATGDGTATAGWKTCRWLELSARPAHYYSILFSGAYTLEDVRNDPNNSNFSDIVIGTRDALLYRMTYPDPSDVCNIAFESGQGVAAVNVQVFRDDADDEDVCDSVREYTSHLEQHFPPN